MNVTSDSFDIHVIRQVIHNFCVVVPICKNLLAAFRKKTAFPTGEQPLRRVIKKIGVLSGKRV